MSGFQGNTAVAAAAMTTLTRDSGRSVLALATEACSKALAAAGLEAPAVDGLSSFSMYGDSVPSEAVAGALGIHDLRYCMDFNQGGQSAVFLVTNAAMAIVPARPTPS